METISRFACASSPLFLRLEVSPRPLIPSRVSIGRLRSHNYNMIKPKKRERRSNQRWRWEDLSGLDPSTEDDQDPSSEEDPALSAEEDQDTTRTDDEMSDVQLGEELEVLEKEAIEGLDVGREPSDYDRRAHIFDESSRIFKVLKERSENASIGGNDNSS